MRYSRLLGAPLGDGNRLTAVAFLLVSVLAAAYDLALLLRARVAPPPGTTALQAFAIVLLCVWIANFLLRVFVPRPPTTQMAAQAKSS